LSGFSRTVESTVNYPSDRRYTKAHEWVSVSGSQGRVGITDYAQNQLGDVVFVELPEVGRTVTQGQACGTIESVKAVSELYCPVSGKVLETNPVVGSKPETLNTDPHGTWLIVVELSNPQELDALLTNDQYAENVK
jgi:glycine cleavage system H protein